MTPLEKNRALREEPRFYASAGSYATICFDPMSCISPHPAEKPYVEITHTRLPLPKYCQNWRYLLHLFGSDRH